MRGYNITGPVLAIALAMLPAPDLLAAAIRTDFPEGPLPARQIEDSRRADAASACRTLRAELDDRISSAGVGDPRHHRRPGIPWLRTDRFLQRELRAAIHAGEALAIGTILARMSALDAAALDRELQQLVPAPTTTSEALDACRLESLAALRAQTSLMLLDDAGAPVEDQYSGLKRFLGGYLLAQPFLRAGARGWQETERTAIIALEPIGARPHLLFVPDSRPAMSAVERAHLLRSLRARHPLAWPETDPQELEQLARQFAPELTVDSLAGADRIGRLEGREGQPRVVIDDPVAYTDFHLVRWGEHVLLQISYTFWFPERPRTGPFDPYGGPIDGIVWRVTLGDDGQPLLWDSIHPCGCYHTLFLPADRALRLGAIDPAHEERPLLLPGPDALAAVRLRYGPGTHHVRELVAGGSKEVPGAEQGAAQRVHYRLEPYVQLLEGSPDRPPFGPDGLLAGTDRLERLFLWPSGIASPGAMRSAGRQPIAFLGRRHFETAELIDGLLRPIPVTQR